MSQQPVKPTSGDDIFPLKYLYISVLVVILFMVFFYFATH